MATRLTGIRQARDIIQGSATLASREMDFNLSSDQGIEIVGVELMFTEMPVPPGNTSGRDGAVQGLIVEPGSIDGTFINPDGSPTEATEIDDLQNIFLQYASSVFNTDETNGVGVSNILQSPGWFSPPEPVLTAENPRHVIHTTSATAWAGLVTVHYRYVRFSRDELAVMFARRR